LWKVRGGCGHTEPSPEYLQGVSPVHGGVGAVLNAVTVLDATDVAVTPV
jgi:hypothetical protein